MKYTDIPCAACGAPFAETDDVVVCPICGAPQHRDCWMKTGSCALNDRHGQGFSWVSPVQPEPPQPERRDREPQQMKNGERVVRCPNCGSDNFENDLYCLRCGAKLHDEPGAQSEGGRSYTRYDDTQNNNFNSREFVDNFNRFGGLDPNSLVDGIPVCEYADFVGGRAPGRIIRRVSVSERFGRSISWSLPAFFFGPIWFFYRKMKKEGLLLSLILILLATGIGLLQINEAFVTYVRQTFDLTMSMVSGEISREESVAALYDLTEKYRDAEITGADAVKLRVANVLQYVMVIGCPLYSGLFGLKRYRIKVRDEILQIRSQCSDMDAYRAMLLKKGGVSPGLAVLGILLMLVAAMCMNYLPIMISMLS